MSIRWIGVSVGLFAALISAPAPAEILSVSDPINFTDYYGVNPIGTGPEIGSTGYYAGGTYDSVGAMSVTPASGTAVTASQGLFAYSIPYLGGAAFPNQFYANLPFNPELTGSWTLTVTNAGPTITNSPLLAVTPSLTVTTPPALVTGVNISGNSQALTINWQVPVGSTATSEAIFIFNATSGGGPSGGAAFASPILAAGTTTYTVPSGILKPGQLYSVSVQSDVRSGGLSGDVEARSRQFTAAFVSPPGTLAVPMYLPSISPMVSKFGGPIFDFDIQVSANTSIAIDPAIATGFIYQTGASNPNFSSVELPSNAGPYQLYLWNGSSFVLYTTLNGNSKRVRNPGDFPRLRTQSSAGLCNTIDVYQLWRFYRNNDAGRFRS
jgi:hypothetical protein